MLPSVKIIIKYSVTYPHFRGVNGHFQVKCAKYSNTRNRFTAVWILTGTTRVSRYHFFVFYI